MVLSPTLILKHCLLLWRCSLPSARCSSGCPRLLSVPLLLCRFCACARCTHELRRWVPWLRIPSLLLEILGFCHFRAQSHGKLRENPPSNPVLPLPPCSNASFRVSSLRIQLLYTELFSLRSGTRRRKKPYLKDNIPGQDCRCAVASCHKCWPVPCFKLLKNRQEYILCMWRLLVTQYFS